MFFRPHQREFPIEGGAPPLALARSLQYHTKMNRCLIIVLQATTRCSTTHVGTICLTRKVHVHHMTEYHGVLFYYFTIIGMSCIFIYTLTKPRPTPSGQLEKVTSGKGYHNANYRNT